MLLTSAVFLLHFLCGLVPCDPRQKPPEVLQAPREPMIFLRNAEVARTAPIVKTDNGIVEGYLMKAMNGRLFMAFQGIPFGEARRWQLAVPTRPWKGIRQTKKRGHDCLQLSLEGLRVIGREECLFLNVFTPSLPNPLSVKKYPVIVFIHGGAFQFSAGADYGPTYLLSEDVIFVTFNYRLGVLGFLSLGNEEVPGNLGLKDQGLAMKWVYENIEYFGGNKFNISLWGQSAGASSVHLHMISEKTRKYFSTAFSSSGTAFNHWAVQSKGRMMELANRLAKKFRCPRNNQKALLRCLQKIDGNFLVAGQFDLYVNRDNRDWFLYPPILFSPTVEPEHPEAFLTVTPTEAYKAGTVSNKPYIVGFTKDEGKNALIVLLALMRMIPLRVLWTQVAPRFLALNGMKTPSKLIAKIEEFYFKGQSPLQVDMNAFGDMIGDRYLYSGIVQGAQAHLSSGSPTYMYCFSFSEGKHNLANFIGYQSKEWGVGHIEDITYLFNFTTLIDGHKQTDPDHELSSIMINLLVNFAATGSPLYRSPEGKFFNVWNPSMIPSKIDVLQLDRNIKMTKFPQNIADRIRFWDAMNIPNMTLWQPIN